MSRESTVAKKTERSKSIEDIQAQAQNLLRNVNTLARARRISSIESRYVGNLTSTPEYTEANYNSSRAMMDNNASAFVQAERELGRLNRRRYPRSQYMR